MRIRGRVVNIWRTPPNKIHLALRKENREKIRLDVSGFRPFFFIEGDGDYESVFGESLKKIKLDDYRSVNPKREKYDEHYEADIPYTRRFLIDNQITDGIDVHDTGTNVKARNIEPAKVDVSLRVVHLDIETYPPTLDTKNTKSEIVSVGVHDTYSKNTSVLIVGEGNNSDPDFHYCDDERELLNRLVKFFKRIDPDLIVGWNVKNYDIKYLNNRMDKIGINHQIYTQVLDLRKADKRMSKRSKYSLNNVVVDEDIRDKDEIKDTIKVLKKYGEENDVDGLAEYNKGDIEDTVELDKRNEYVRTYSTRKGIVGIENYDKIFSRGVPIDTMAMRILREENKVVPRLPTEEEVKERREEKERLKKEKETIGGRVTNPPVGKFKNVSFFDMSRYYPTILKVFNISPETIGQDIDELGIIPRLCEVLNKRRDKIDNLLSEANPGTERYEKLQLRKENLKTLVNAVSGYIGFEWGRLYSLECYNKMTSLAREGLTVLEKKAEELGYKTLYQDTDGIFVQCPLDQARELCGKLEEGIIQHFKEEYDVDASAMELDFERFYDAILWKEKSAGVGAKKRYAGHVVWEGEECDYFIIKGFECIRIDSSDYIRDKQKKLLKKLLTQNEESVRGYVKKLIDNFEESEPEYICGTTRIGKKLDGYKSPPPHARGSLYANMYLDGNFQKGDRPYILYVKDIEGGPKTDVVCFENGVPDCTIDWETMREKTLKQGFEDVLDIIGINYEKLAMDSDGQKFLEEW